jgi:hypothetical protein
MAALSSTVTTRRDTDVWIVGQPIDEIRGRKLPSKGDVLRRFFYLLRTDQATVKGASGIVIREVMSFWEMARIPTIAIYNAVPKVEREYDKWRALQKDSSRRSTLQIDRERIFRDELADLFDVAHANALGPPTLAEDQEFLLAQREKGRRGFMSGVDKQFDNKETRIRLRKASEERKQTNEKARCDELAMTELASSSSDEEQQPTITAAESSSRKRKRARKNVITSDMASALDRTLVSDRKAVYILSAAASSLGHNVQELSINRSTIRRRRIDTRQCISELIKESFAPNIPLTVHWDGKLLPALTGSVKVDRLPVLVSGGGLSKLLGVPKLPCGTGQAIAKAVMDCLEDWGVKDRIQAMSFDTTSSNTGCKSGACTLLEEMVGRDLLHLACRHHIIEIVAEKVFVACDNPSTGPDILLFKRFQQQWQLIDKKQFQVLDDNVNDREDILSFCRQQLAVKHPRDDYRELLELTMIFLGSTPSRGIRFMQPGALHRARWMARVIYAIKLCLFHSQFVMTKREQAGIKRFAVFGVIVYVRSWFEAPQAAAAPANDLALLKQLASYDDKHISDAALTAYSRHLWYLSESLVALSFLDSDTCLSVKRDMVKALDIEGSHNPLNRIEIDASTATFSSKTLADFVTHRSRGFFDRLSLCSDFLTVDPGEWESRPDYQTAAAFVRTMKVVNDSAERGVALMQTYNGILTKNEDQKQYLLQVVEQHRQKFPNATKETVAGI